MAVYNTVQSGGLRQVGPGENLTLFDGTEADQNVASVAHARGYSGGQSQFYRTYFASGAGTETITLEGANVDNDVDYATVGTFSTNQNSPTDGNQFLTDSGSARFYRVRKTGGTPVVTVQA